MKKIVILLSFLALILIGCSDNSEGTDTDEAEKNKESQNEPSNDTNEENEEKDVYQVGDTADIISNSFGFPYQVTLNSAEFTTEDVDGISLEDRGYSPDEGGQFLVANITIKNTGDSSITPQEQLSAQLYNEEYPMLSSLDETFTERNDALEPGEEITGNLVYNYASFEDYDVYYLTFEAEATKEETRFEIPVP